MVIIERQREEVCLAWVFISESEDVYNMYRVIRGCLKYMMPLSLAGALATSQKGEAAQYVIRKKPERGESRQVESHKLC